MTAILSYSASSHPPFRHRKPPTAPPPRLAAPATATIAVTPKRLERYRPISRPLVDPPRRSRCLDWNSWVLAVDKSSYSQSLGLATTSPRINQSTLTAAASLTMFSNLSYTTTCSLSPIIDTFVQCSAHKQTPHRSLSGAKPWRSCAVVGPFSCLTDNPRNSAPVSGRRTQLYQTIHPYLA
ncbi:hypothetical protein LIA77_07044 [Sarocladium implicatum]|nr:hypothetical protein LIA77_07044 [Sarocladium implicatum]